MLYKQLLYGNQRQIPAAVGQIRKELTWSHSTKQRAAVDGVQSREQSGAGGAALPGVTISARPRAADNSIPTQQDSAAAFPQPLLGPFWGEIQHCSSP